MGAGNGYDTAERTHKTEGEPVDQASRAQLRLFLRFRNRPPTILAQFAANRGRYLFLLAGTCVLAGLSYLVDGGWAGRLVGAAAAGAVVRDIGLFRRVAAGWPITREVINWAKVELLLANDDQSPPDDNPLQVVD